MPLRLALAASLLGLAPDAQAEGAPSLRLGPVDVHPFYDVRAAYDDNIYRVNRDKADGTRQGCLPGNASSCSGGFRGSWLLTNVLGLDALLPLGETQRLKASYQGTAVKYRVQPRANDAIYQAASLAFDFKGALLAARFWDDFLSTEDPPYNPNTPLVNTGVSVIGGELASRQNRWQNVAGASLEYALGDTFFLGLRAQGTRHKYRSPSLAALIDRSEQLYGGRIGYKIQPKTRLFVSVDRGLTHYSAGRRGANHRDYLVSFGLEGELTGKLKGRVQTGMSYRQYDADGMNVSASTTSTNWTVETGATYKPLERTTVDLALIRGLSESTSVRFYLTNTAALSVQHTLGRATARLGGTITIDKYGDSQTVPAGIGFSASRRDDTYAGFASFSYQLASWLTASAEYRRMQRHSTFTGEFNYADNTTSFGLRAGF